MNYYKTFCAQFRLFVITRPRHVICSIHLCKIHLIVSGVDRKFTVHLFFPFGSLFFFFGTKVTNHGQHFQACSSELLEMNELCGIIGSSTYLLLSLCTTTSHFRPPTYLRKSLSQGTRRYSQRSASAAVTDDCCAMASFNCLSPNTRVGSPV